MSNRKKILITGAGGFIGGHLVKYFLDKDEVQVRAVDIKPQKEWQQLHQVENVTSDLSRKENAIQVSEEIDEVYNLASQMGGVGFIENNKAICMLNVLINTHLLMAAKETGVKRYFFASSACVYANDKQQSPDNPGLKETDAYPADPEDGYGWEKLFGERMCRHYTEDFGLTTRVARPHNVYGPHTSYKDGREKAPAALARKIATAKINGSNEIEIWGDGEQARTFTYIDDCVEGIDKIMHSQLEQPVNLGSSELVTINQLVDVIEEIADIRLKRKYILDAPKGVRGRSSDNTLIKKHLNWEPTTSLKSGMKQTYDWVYQQVLQDLK